MNPILSVKNISAGYGPIEVLKGISAEIFPGELVTIIGANGAGKTSLLRAVSGLLKPKSGTVSFEGKEYQGTRACELVKRGLAHVPEGRRIFPRLTVRENLELGAYLQCDKATIAGDMDKIFRLFPILKDRLKQDGGTLSGGEQQMLAIGRALMSRPKVLLMDEPSMGVAPLLVRRIFDTIAELNATGMTILLVEQNAHLALKLATRGYVIETGRIVLQDAASKLLEDPRVRKAYLGED